jgi:hypothetical protein
MTRPHTEFIQSQALPWQASPYDGRFAGTQIKGLSRDDESGAASLLVRYPAGWHREAAEYLSADEEFFVLDGTLTINGRSYSQMCYGHLPAGYPRSAAASDGAVVLTFLSQQPATIAGSPPDGLYDPSRLVACIDVLNTEPSTDLRTLDVDQTDEMVESFSAFAHILFREDPHTHDQTWLLSARPLWQGNVVEIHPVVEEMYLVAGDMAGERGLMKAGAYFWRPPGLRHGPFGSKTGNLMFFRTQGGPLRTVFEPGADIFSWNPEHRPVLPDALVAYGQDAGDESVCW